MSDFECFDGMMREYFRQGDGKITVEQYECVLRAQSGSRPYIKQFYIREKDDFKIIEKKLKAGFTRAQIIDCLVEVNGYERATGYKRISDYFQQLTAQKDLFSA